MKKLRWIVCVLTLTVAANAAWAQNPPAAPAGAQEIDVKVLEVKGKARYRAGSGAAWQPVTTDSPVTVLSEFQTGPNSHIKLRVGPNSEVTLKGLGTLTIAQVAANGQDKVLQTRLAQKYGRVNVEVQRVGEMRNDYRIATPGMVLAVKGSGGNIWNYGPNWEVNWQHGNTEQQTNETNNLQGGDDTNDENPNPAQNKEQQTNFNSNFYPGGPPSSNDPHQGYGGTQYNNLNDNRQGAGSNDSSGETIRDRMPNNGDNGDNDDEGPGGEFPV